MLKHLRALQLALEEGPPDFGGIPLCCSRIHCTRSPGVHARGRRRRALQSGLWCTTGGRPARAPRAASARREPAAGLGGVRVCEQRAGVRHVAPLRRQGQGRRLPAFWEGAVWRGARQAKQAQQCWLTRIKAQGRAGSHVHAHVHVHVCMHMHMHMHMCMCMCM